MKTAHLSEQQIQQYALDKSACETDSTKHLDACEKCRAGVTAYQALFSAIEAAPKAAFNFDVTCLVLAQLPETKPAFHQRIPAVYVILFFSIAFGSLAFYVFRPYLMNLFAGLSAIVFCLLAATALTIVVFESIADYKTYNHKIKALDFY